MSLDRRIVSILYFNGITDIETVEHFSRVNEKYYEALVNGKFIRLRIQGKDYSDEIEEKNEIVQPIKETIFLKEEELEKNVAENKENLEKIKKEIKPKKPKNGLKISDKKIKIEESKKIDDDSDNFIDSL